MRERLFHTLDPATRSFEIAGRTYLLTDTVGFIRKLPHQLVEAFSATLEEALGADLIVHVADASVAEGELHEMLAAVDDVLDEIGAGDRPRLLVLNKVDLLDEERRRELSFRFPKAVQVSAAEGEGLEELREAVEAHFLSSLLPMELLVPYSEGGSLSELHELAGELEREDTPAGVLVKARVPAAAVQRFERFALNGRHGVILRFRRLTPEARPPARAHDGDAGFDLHAVGGRLDRARARAPAWARAWRWRSRTGYAGLVVPRSGLAARHGISLVNAPGLIDAGYRGELRVLLMNGDPEQTFERRSGRPDRPARAGGGGGPRARGGRPSWTRRSAARAASARPGAEKRLWSHKQALRRTSSGAFRPMDELPIGDA